MDGFQELYNVKAVGVMSMVHAFQKFTKLKILSDVRARVSELIKASPEKEQNPAKSKSILELFLLLKMTS